jgi:hypothetical protein
MIERALGITLHDFQDRCDAEDRMTRVIRSIESHGAGLKKFYRSEFDHLQLLVECPHTYIATAIVSRLFSLDGGSALLWPGKMITEMSFHIEWTDRERVMGADFVSKLPRNKK